MLHQIEFMKLVQDELPVRLGEVTADEDPCVGEEVYINSRVYEVTITRKNYKINSVLGSTVGTVVFVTSKN